MIGDAFGDTLRRCFLSGMRPNETFEVIERSDGHIGVADAANYFLPFDEWPMLDRAAAGLAVGRVLDVGCGAGRLGIDLASRGLAVVGVDHSEAAVEVACARGLAAIHSSATALPLLDSTFETIVMLCQGLGILGNATTGGVILNELARVSVPGGRLVATGRDPNCVPGCDFKRYMAANVAKNRMPGQLRIRIRSGILSTEYFDQLLCSKDDLEKLTLTSPWRVQDYIDGTEGNYVAVCQKGG